MLYIIQTEKVKATSLTFLIKSLPGNLKNRQGH